MKKCCLLVLCVCLFTATIGVSALGQGEVAFDERVNAMLPVMDSIALPMAWGESVYQPLDPEYFWAAICMMGVNWTAENPQASLADDYCTLRLPRQLVQEIASALFFDYDDLLPIPESMEDTVWYEEPMDAYLINMGDRGELTTVIESVTPGDQGALKVAVVVYNPWGEDDPETHVVFELVPNPYVDGITEPTYSYSVSSAQKIEEP